MAAQITSADHAEEFVRWAKFAPRGRRGLNPLGYDGGYGSTPLAVFAERANRDTFVAVQIETAQAVEEADAIAAIDGVDLLFVGPSDLSQAVGSIGDFTGAASMAAVERVAAACRAHGKHWGAVTPSPAYAEMLAEKGCTLISLTNDVKLVGAGLAAVRKDYSAFWD
jgi:2-dehydro-3-deoxyglucarate aldolase/4-hydroxy-2-oxoheptanedioate aldolase